MIPGALSPYRPTLICAAITLAATPLYVIRWHYGFYPTTLLETLIVVTVVAFVVESVRQRTAIEWRSPVTVAGVLFLIAGAISVVVSTDRRAGLGLYRAYLIEPMAFFLVVAAITHTVRRAHLLVGGLCVGTLIVGVPNAIVVLQAFRHHTLDLAGTPPVVIYTTANAVALFLLPAIAVAGAILLYAEGRLERRAAAVYLVIAVPCFLLTLSRGGYLALLVVVLALAVTHRLRWYFAGAALAIAIAFGVVPPIRRRLSHEVNFSDPTNTLVGRSHLWKATLQMLQHHPLFGSGLAGFAAAIYPYWGGLGHTDRFIDPHNILLNFWTETGVLGVIAFTWLLISAFLASWRGWRAQIPGWRAIQLGVFLALVGIVVHGLVDVPYFKNDLSLEFWALLGLSWAAIRWSGLATTSEPAGSLRKGAAATPR